VSYTTTEKMSGVLGTKCNQGDQEKPGHNPTAKKQTRALRRKRIKHKRPQLKRLGGKVPLRVLMNRYTKNRGTGKGIKTRGVNSQERKRSGSVIGQKEKGSSRKEPGEERSVT